MINKFDTYSDRMTDHCMELSRWIFEMSAISRYGEGFMAWIFKNCLDRSPDFEICYKLILNDYSYYIWESSDNYFYVFY